MTLERIEELWGLAKKLHEARIACAWGPRFVGVKEPWPEFSSAYSHEPIAFVDLALAQADVV